MITSMHDHNYCLFVHQILLPKRSAVPDHWTGFKKVEDSRLSLSNCGNGKLFLYQPHYRRTSGRLVGGGWRIKTSTGAEGPPEAKGGPWGALKGHNKATEVEAIFLGFRESTGNKERLSAWVHLWKGPLAAHIKETAYNRKTHIGNNFRQRCSINWI